MSDALIAELPWRTEEPLRPQGIEWLAAINPGWLSGSELAKLQVIVDQRADEKDTA